MFQPFNATRIAASGIDNRVRQLAKDTSNKEDGRQGKGGFWDEFEVILQHLTFKTTTFEDIFCCLSAP